MAGYPSMPPPFPPPPAHSSQASGVLPGIASMGLGAQDPAAYGGYPRPRTGEEQWVDGPGTTAPPAAAPPAAPVSPPAKSAQPDMLYQWVDCPSYGRSQMHQQQYSMPHVPMYYGGTEPSPYDLHAAPLPPQAAPAARHPQAMHMEDLGSRMASPGVTEWRTGNDVDHSGWGDPAGGYQSASRRAGGPAGGPSRPMRGGTQPLRDTRGQQADAGGKGRGRTPNQPGTIGGSGSPVGAASRGAQRSAEVSADAQLAAVLETLGHGGIREILSSALESIYRDRIKPMANYVKGRLKERSCPEPVVKSFLELYAQHSDLFVLEQPSGADEKSIFFKTEPNWFQGWVDIDSPEDPYDEAVWEDLAKFLDSDRTFAGGRYGMARELMQQNLPFLAQFSLGEICQIVQLAIQHRRLIVYHRKMLKPIQTIMCQSPQASNKTAGTESEITDMNQLCVLLFRMLIRHPEGIQLSRMKQVFKYEFSCVISEMAFQCTKLSELFSREPLVETFKLETEDGGKSMYVRLNTPSNFTPQVKQFYQKARQEEAALATQLN